MPARNSASTPATLGHGFDCPMGDGGHCALPSPPILVQGGRMRQATDEVEDLRALSVGQVWIARAKETGVDGMREIVDQSADDQPGQAPAILLPCSCGHVVTARDLSIST